MAALRRFLTELHHDEEGQGLVEYGLILAFASIVCIASMAAVGQAIQDVFWIPAQVLP